MIKVHKTTMKKFEGAVHQSITFILNSKARRFVFTSAVLVEYPDQVIICLYFFATSLAVHLFLLLYLVLFVPLPCVLIELEGSTSDDEDALYLTTLPTDQFSCTKQTEKIGIGLNNITTEKAARNEAGPRECQRKNRRQS